MRTYAARVVVDAGSEQHWDDAYARDTSELSWYEASPTTSLELIALGGSTTKTAVLDVGAGASALVDHLLDLGYTDLSALDVSAAALRAAQRRLGERARQVTWLREDVLTWSPERAYGLWHDRAAFHFLTSHVQRLAYGATMRAALRDGGLVVVGTFAEDGPTQCSGLPVRGYSPEGLAAALDVCLEVLATRRELHVTPWGATQPFSWVLARLS